MTLLLHHDTCVAYLRGRPTVTRRLPQHQGQLHVSAATILSLELWLLRGGTPSRLVTSYGALLQQVRVVNVDDPIAHQAARLGSQLRRQGRRLPALTLLVAATALVNAFPLVTHSPSFAAVPGLTLADWFLP